MDNQTIPEDISFDLPFAFGELHGKVVLYFNHPLREPQTAIITWVDPSVEGQVNLCVLNDESKKMDWLNAVQYNHDEKIKKRTWKFIGQTYSKDVTAVGE